VVRATRGLVPGQRTLFQSKRMSQGRGHSIHTCPRVPIYNTRSHLFRISLRQSSSLEYVLFSELKMEIGKTDSFKGRCES